MSNQRKFLGAGGGSRIPHNRKLEFMEGCCFNIYRAKIPPFRIATIFPSIHEDAAMAMNHR